MGERSHLSRRGARPPWLGCWEVGAVGHNERSTECHAASERLGPVRSHGRRFAAGLTWTRAVTAALLLCHRYRSEKGSRSRASSRLALLQGRACAASPEHVRSQPEGRTGGGSTWDRLRQMPSSTPKGDHRIDATRTHVSPNTHRRTGPGAWNRVRLQVGPSRPGAGTCRRQVRALAPTAPGRTSGLACVHSRRGSSCRQ